MRAEDNNSLKIWLSKLTDKNRKRHLLSGDIQNEIIQLYKTELLNILLKDINGTFSIQCDGTQDISGNEQEIIVVRYLTSKLDIKEICIGICNMTEATTGENIANLILSELEHLNLPISKLRGQSYDGAANMSGKCNGVKTIIMNRQPLAFYTHCGAHRTNLIAQSLDNNISIRKALGVVNDLGLLYERTIKFRNVYHAINQKAKKLKPLCPTRWTMRKPCIRTALDQYSGIIDALKGYKELDNITNDQKDIADSLLKNMNKSNIFLSMNISSLIFESLDMMVKSFMTPTNTIEGKIYKNIH